MDVADVFKNKDIALVAFDPKGEKFDISKLPVQKTGVLIGPEGGWTDRELEMFRKNNVAIYSLGTQILRAETAAVAASSLLLLS